jgi:hypothetical protein
MSRRPRLPPKKLPIDLATVDTAKGRWLIAIDSIVETQGGRNLLLGAILEQNIDDETFRSRKFGITVDRLDARNPDKCSYLLDRIRTCLRQPRETVLSI